MKLALVHVQRTLLVAHCFSHCQLPVNEIGAHNAAFSYALVSWTSCLSLSVYLKCVDVFEIEFIVCNPVLPDLGAVGQRMSRVDRPNNTIRAVSHIQGRGTIMETADGKRGSGGRSLLRVKARESLLRKGCAQSQSKSHFRGS